MGKVIDRLPSQGITIEVEDAPSPELTTFLRSRVWGKGGVRYQSLDSPPSQRSASRGLKTYFLSLRRFGEVIGSYRIEEKVLTVDGRRRRAVYRSGLAVAELYEGCGFGSLLVKSAKRLIAGLPKIDFSYGFIERRNRRSLQVLRANGYRRVGSFEALVMSRLRPRDSRWIHRKDRDGGVFEFRRCGQTTARIACHPLCLRVYLKWLPAFRVNFLAWDRVECRDGCESDLLDLMEGLLSRHRAWCGVIFLDSRDRCYDAIRRSGRLGWLNRCLRTGPIDMMALASKSMMQRLRRTTFCIDAGDVIG